MIGYIKGKILLKREDSVLVEAGGVGYRVFLAKNVITEIASGEEKEFYCYHFVREDTNELFGFDSPAELDIFEKLILVPGVGPKLALAIVSTLGRDKILSAISQNNPTIFKSVSGVGGKLAAKIVIELKSKLSGGATIMPQDDETVDALVALGYKKNEIVPLLSQIPADIIDTNDKIKYALKLVSKN